MPTITMELRDSDVYALLGPGQPFPLEELRQDFKAGCAPILGYPEKAFIVNWDLSRPGSGTDPDSRALVITVRASNKQDHRDVGVAWVDAMEKVVKSLDCFDDLMSLGGATIFLPVGEGFFRVIKG